jgi:hypothetical protein
MITLREVEAPGDLADSHMPDTANSNRCLFSARTRDWRSTQINVNPITAVK